ncbi:hypothetical protein M434DRAFT_398158 [Hypoxylon sp. CO27-5]|nr:hypothetical protein M434DRAFT_398158 [Hypoxylon sp. CO27-5]
MTPAQSGCPRVLIAVYHTASLHRIPRLIPFHPTIDEIYTGLSIKVGQAVRWTLQPITLMVFLYLVLSLSSCCSFLQAYAPRELSHDVEILSSDVCG